MTKALAMISGGLDSILAAKLIKDQGIDVIGICFKSYFFGPKNAIKMTDQVGIPLEVVDFSSEHFELVKSPKHGYGKNINPCIDCHTMMLNYTGKLLEKYAADFIITGEVLNQRPMSQNRISLDIVKKESGFSDKILRPLCAKNLNPTKMELEGLVDREKLLDISGRSRKVQMELAEKWGIVDYPSPAGGCRLTEPGYANRLRELLEHKETPTTNDLELLRLGRHFRISEKAKIISCRTAEETVEIKNCLTTNDMIFLAEDFKGSMVIIVGEPTQEDIEFAAKVTGRYCKGKNEEKVNVKYGYYKQAFNKKIEVKPATEDEINKYMLQK